MKTALLDHLVAIRRQIHQNPELGFRETNTARLVKSELEKIGIEVKSEIAITGLVGIIDNGPGPCIALRADMDALPIKEESGLDFSSNNDGVMHACGHDLHTTMLLGAAHLLKESEFRGKIKLIFQPSEEGTYPTFFEDGSCRSGGQRMVEAGELDDVDAALGLHVHPLVPTGKMAFCLGQSLAATSFFKITITGKAGHAAFPDKTIDPILVCSQIITAAQNIVSRYSDPGEPKVISFTKLEGGSAENIIPEQVKIMGTIRALDAVTYDGIIARLQDVLQGIEIISKASIRLTFTLNYPSLLNDSNIHSRLSGVLDDTFGRQNLVEIKPIMGGEDFAFYSRKKPSMFYFLGACNGQNPYFLHHPSVVFDEGCISYGAEFLTAAALKLLDE